MSDFVLEPFVGPLPLRFGMTERQVRAVLGPPRALRRYPSGQCHRLYPGLKVLFGRTGRVSSVTLIEGEVGLRLGEMVLLGPWARRDPLPQLLAWEARPLESVGILILPSLGLSTAARSDPAGRRTYTALSKRALAQMVRGAAPFVPEVPKDYDPHAGLLEPDWTGSIRKRPGMYLGDARANGLHHLVGLLLREAAARSGRHGLARLQATLGRDGSVVVADSCSSEPEQHLVPRYMGVTSATFGGRPSLAYPIAAALSARFGVDLWKKGSQFRQRVSRSAVVGRPQRVRPAVAPPLPGRQVFQVGLSPDPLIFGRTLRLQAPRLDRRLAELAALHPGLRTTLVDGRSGRRIWHHYPDGLAGYVRDALPKRVRPPPLLTLEVEEGHYRVRLALLPLGHRLRGGVALRAFANGHPCSDGAHVEGVARALADALA